jgi:hypothetical protein
MKRVDSFLVLGVPALLTMIGLIVWKARSANDVQPSPAPISRVEPRPVPNDQQAEFIRQVQTEVSTREVERVEAMRKRGQREVCLSGTIVLVTGDASYQQETGPDGAPIRCTVSR